MLHIVVNVACAFVYIAKNLVLAGVKSVTLHDVRNVELWDLSSSFVFTEADVGKNRALASMHKLQELNNSVLISTLTTELTKEQLSDFQVICLSMWLDISLFHYVGWAYFISSYWVSSGLFVIYVLLIAYLLGVCVH